MFPIPIISSLRVQPSNPGIKTLTTGPEAKSVVLQYNSGETYALGANTSGMYGTGTTTDITGNWALLRNDVRLFACCGNFSILITKDNKVYGSGSLNTIFTSALGYSISNSTTYQDITSAFSRFDISAIQAIQGYNDTPARLFVVDGSGQIWGIGSNQYYALGAGSGTGTYNWTALTSGTNVKKIQCTLYGTWILKNDGTAWRCGTNSVATLGFGSKTSTQTTFGQYTPGTGLTVLDVGAGQYNCTLLLSDGTIRTCGASYGTGNGTTTGQLAFYNPGLSAINRISSMNFYSTFVIGASQMMSTGDNNSGRLAISTSTSPTNFVACAGTVQSQTLSSITYMCNIVNASYYVYQGLVYAAGGAAMTLGTTNTPVYRLMPTPYK
ncbi:hypothetical protein XaC1_558 [Xanthomonas phage XaC1]|nr:hypothetical protein XaC1_558 [Xanthomonas phage XaC1]